jgi:hypothetical protein
VVAAILTLVGFDINDTIIVFDRIRENLSKDRKRPLGEVINSAINQTLSRTILTSGTVMFVLFCLYFSAARSSTISPSPCWSGCSSGPARPFSWPVPSCSSMRSSPEAGGRRLSSALIFMGEAGDEKAGNRLAGQKPRLNPPFPHLA